MAKTNKKSPVKHKRPWGKYILFTLVALALIVPAAYINYQKQLDKVDAERFATLQLDFKKLQVEFNKIDPGWKYKEGCAAGGKLDDFKVCTVVIQDDVQSNSADTVLSKYSRLMVQIDPSLSLGRKFNTTSDAGSYYVGYVVDNKNVNDGSCELGAIQKGDSSVSLSLSCSNSARDFYFVRTDE